MLKFSPANAKLIALQQKTGKKVYSLSTVSGESCPYAMSCESKVVETTNGLRIEDGKDTEYRCYSASQEVLYPTVYRQRKYNYELLLACNNDLIKLATLINDSLPKDAEIVRAFVGGDFFTKNYFQAWMMVGFSNPDKLFYAYTKSIPFWIWGIELNIIPENFILTASYGGRRDDLIAPNNLKYAKVVKSVKEAKQLGLKIDHDDSLAALPKYRNVNLCHLIHSPQPKNSEYGEAVRKLKGKGSYNRKKAFANV